tara:strand:- start:84 stop:245 length:162 start_codon:yes stop_codon:yes gene_type:complete
VVVVSFGGKVVDDVVVLDVVVELVVELVVVVVVEVSLQVSVGAVQFPKFTNGN